MSDELVHLVLTCLRCGGERELDQPQHWQVAVVCARCPGLPAVSIRVEAVDRARWYLPLCPPPN